MSRWTFQCVILSVCLCLLMTGLLTHAQSIDEVLPLPKVTRPSLTIPSQEAFQDWPSLDVVSSPFWMPWSELAFSRASAFGRPILLVLAPGWDRRSQRTFSEVYSVPAVGREVNDHYIAVLAHPDLRPDLKERYQTGLWPVQVLLLPNGDPMVSQVNDRKVAKPITMAELDPGRMRYLLQEGDVYWNKWASLLYEVGAEWTSREGPAESVRGILELPTSDRYEQWLMSSADPQGGGFGLAPKRVVPGLYQYGWMQRARVKPGLERHAKKTIDVLLSSPLHDKSRGGIFRISLDADYENIQYEKLLRTQVEWLNQLIARQRIDPSDEVRSALVATTQRLKTKYKSKDHPGFFNSQVADAKSRDGGGFYRGEHETEPPFEQIILSGESANTSIALIKAGLFLEDPELVEFGKKTFEEILQKSWALGRGVAHSILPLDTNSRFLWSQAAMGLAAWEYYQLTGSKLGLDAARDIGRFTEQNLSIADDVRWVDHLPREQAFGLMNKPRYPTIPNIQLASLFRRVGLHDEMENWLERGREVLEMHAGDLEEYRVNGIPIALAIEEYVSPPLYINLQGSLKDERIEQSYQQIHQAVAPWTIITRTENENFAIEISFKDDTRSLSDPSQIQSTIKDLIGWIDGSEE